MACGLGARDTLRLEMGYPLNGNDLSEERTPLQAGLGFFVDFEKEDFTGREALVAQKVAGLRDKLVAFRMTGAAPPPRPHYPVAHAGEIVSEVCSGTHQVSASQRRHCGPQHLAICTKQGHRQGGRGVDWAACSSRNASFSHNMRSLADTATC